jgi:predicted component of type VI protein secretion system
MAELWIRYKDEYGEERRVAVDKDSFVIGRQPDCDLAIADSRLSRRHLTITRGDEGFSAEDAGSSNGTDYNGEPMFEAIDIRDGDRADLGGGLEIEFELRKTAEPEPPAAGEPSGETPSPPEAAASARGVPKSARAAGNGGFSAGWLLLAPVLGLILLVSVVGIVLIFGGRATADADDDNRFIYSSNNRRDDSDDGPTPSGTTTASTPSNSSSNADTSASPSPTPADLSETAKVERSAAVFLRSIAQNDPTAFLTSEQAKRVSAKIKQYGGSSAVAENINSARRSAAQLRSLAAAKNLKPQLIATAALAKLGTQRGDVLATATSMADVLDRLGTQIGSERADDAILMIAAYGQGQAGDFLRMRNMLQDLATKSPESSRAIRTIWFLEKQGKITPAEFEFALRFLAIGTITQNPKDFGVNAEALTL